MFFYVSFYFLIRYCATLKHLSHWSHSNSFSPLCLLLRLARFSAWLKHLPHSSHSKGFSPLCVILCLVRFCALLKRLPHLSHSKYFSPQCLLLWLDRFPAWLKHLQHCSRSNGFFPIFVVLCALRCPACLKHLPHLSHSKGFPPLCVLFCVLKRPAWLKPLPLWSRSRVFFPCSVLLHLCRSFDFYPGKEVLRSSRIIITEELLCWSVWFAAIMQSCSFPIIPRIPLRTKCGIYSIARRGRTKKNTQFNARLWTQEVIKTTTQPNINTTQTSTTNIQPLESKRKSKSSLKE